MSVTGKDMGYFSGYVREFFADSATLEILDCPVIARGSVVKALKSDFAAQSLRTGLTRNDYVEGRVEANPEGAPQPYRLKFITKII